MNKRNWNSTITHRLLKDNIARHLMLGLTVLCILLLVVIGIVLLYKSLPIIREKHIHELLFSSQWKPFKGDFGFNTYIISTLHVTLLSVVIALPFSLFAGIYLSEYATRRMRNFFFPVVDLLSGIPPVIYGVWGSLTIVPLIARIASKFGIYSNGYSVLAGSIVLAIMITPMIISLLVEMLRSIPKEMREASWSLGATKWETIRKVLLFKSIPGIIAIIVLALTRACGETIAVLMVCGNLNEIPHSIFDSCYPLPALIANNFGEMMSVPSYEAALMFAALLLFILMVVFNSASRLVLYQLNKRNRL